MEDIIYKKFMYLPKLETHLVTSTLSEKILYGDSGVQNQKNWFWHFIDLDFIWTVDFFTKKIFLLETQSKLGALMVFVICCVYRWDGGCDARGKRSPHEDHGGGTNGAGASYPSWRRAATRHSHPRGRSRYRADAISSLRCSHSRAQSHSIPIWEDVMS